MRLVEHIMGMPNTVDIPDCKDEAVFRAVFKFFNEVDERFSPYKKDSELSRFNGGEIEGKGLSSDMKEVIKACKNAEKETDGYFSAWYKKDFDPSGYVKGWSIKRAGNLIKKLGYKTFCISAGGDIWGAGEKIWKIGIQDPTDPKKLLNLSMLAPNQNLSRAVGNRIIEHQVFGAGLSISNGAVATSGSYERGQHIINPKTGQPAAELLSLTVTGPDIIKADVLATAAFAMGSTGIDFVNKIPGYKAYAVHA